MPNPNQPLQPKGSGVKTFAHKTFDTIEADISAWYSLPGVRQVFNVTTYPVVETQPAIRPVKWFTVIHYIIYM